MKRTVLIVMIGLFSFLCGCRKQAEPIPFPEGATLTGLYLSVIGDAMQPYYILRTVNGNTYVKITSSDPCDGWDGDDATSPYFACADTVTEGESARLVMLTDGAPVRTMEEWITAYSVLNWDGFDKKVSHKGRLDGDKMCNFYLELSDGTTVTVRGYNAAPDGFYDFAARVADLLEQICAEG